MPKFEMLDESDNVREGLLKHEHYLALLAVLPTHLGTLLVLGCHFGMRSGELRALRWDQVDWDSNLIRLEKKQTKGTQARVAPLYGDLRAWIEQVFSARDQSSPYVITWKWKAIESGRTACYERRRKSVSAGCPFTTHGEQQSGT